MLRVQGGRVRRRGWRQGLGWAPWFVWIMVSWLACAPAWAGLRALRDGEVPTLAADEGLLLVAVDTSVPLTAARLEGERATSISLPGLTVGRGYRLLVASRGRYRWDQVDTATTHLRLADDPELQFQVEAGRLSYVGDLVLRPLREEGGVIVEASATLANRSLAAMDWLQAAHPRLQSEHRFHYAGRYPDPFPDFYAHEQPGPGDAAITTSFDPPPALDAPTPVAMSRLVREPRFDHARLNPAGDLLALQVRDGDDAWRVDVIDLARGTSTPVALGPQPQGQLSWASDRRLVLGTGSRVYERSVRVVDLHQQGGAIAATSAALPRTGEVLHARNDVLVFAFLEHGAVQVRRLDMSHRTRTGDIDVDRGVPLAPQVATALHWETDGRGQPRLARVQRGGEEFWVHGRKGAFRDVLRLGQGLDMEPVALARDGRTLYALTEQGRTQRDAVAIDLATGTVTRTLFSRPGVDVSELVLDERREPVGVVHVRDGRRVSEFFGAPGARAGRLFERMFPGEAVSFASRSADGRRWAVWVQADDHPPRLQVVDLDSARVLGIGGNTPWLDGLPLANTQLLRVPTDDGLTLDAFLTLPAGDTRAPIVVMPHGGPIGIADTRQFDAKVQFLAAMGYAVLRVNFRGSAGYGRAFREAGYRAHGAAIEDDVGAAIAFALAADARGARRIDADRMCLVGSSYGGYSGLMAAVRWPGRFRCVVSIGGVSDRLLAFTASDSATSAQGRAQMEQVVGDPRTQGERMRATSPLYRYRELRTPVMLAHGIEDRRVDFEQSRRLARMLALAGRRPVGLAFEDEGHGLAKPDNIDRLWNGIAAFLQQALGVRAQHAQGAIAVAAP